MDLGAVTGKITHQPPIEELDIGPLLAHEGPLGPPKPTEP
jgi:hypothetical protein